MTKSRCIKAAIFFNSIIKAKFNKFIGLIATNVLNLNLYTVT